MPDLKQSITSGEPSSSKAMPTVALILHVFASEPCPRIPPYGKYMRLPAGERKSAAALSVLLSPIASLFMIAVYYTKKCGAFCSNVIVIVFSAMDLSWWCANLDVVFRVYCHALKPKYLLALLKEMSSTIPPSHFRSFGISPFSTSSPSFWQRSRRKYSWRV